MMPITGDFYRFTKRNISCPLCKAKAGYPCMTKNGKVSSILHVQRKQKALRNGGVL